MSTLIVRRNYCCTARRLTNGHIKMDMKHLTIVALKVYFTRGMAKVAIGLAKGKKTHDKRQDLKRKDTQRGLDRLRKLSR